MRTWLGLVVVVVGVVLLVVGWYDVSGEADVGRQLPYLVSASIPGGALVVAGAVLIAAERWREAAARTDQKVDALYALFTEPVDTAVPPATPPDDESDRDGHVVALDGTSRYHRPACPLVSGKAAHDVAAADVAAAHLQPCEVCDPPPPAGI
jgi:hypothetical protein